MIYHQVSDACAPEFTVKGLVRQRNRTIGRKASRQRETSAALAALFSESVSAYPSFRSRHSLLFASQSIIHAISERKKYD